MSEVRAEIVGNVMDVAVRAGDHVEAGDVVVLLESMKMEIPMRAPDAGRVGSVEVAVGDVVHDGDLVAVVEAPAPA